MLTHRLLLSLAAVAILHAQPAIFPLKQVRPGMVGVGKTVFSGSRVEEFRVEILGVLENVGPKQSLILARLSGGPLKETGVLQGMSGSPVYLEGKLAGAVAMAFPFSKEPIAGIRPIEDMLAMARTSAPAGRTEHAAFVPWAIEPGKLLPSARDSVRLGNDSRLMEIATPVSFGGFTERTLDTFAAQLRELGLESRQAISGGGNPPPRATRPMAPQPGSMISVQLVTGDYSVGADGTVTAVDGDKLYAFGHRFLALGDTQLPFARSEVITLLPNLSSSFKISTAREWLGSITQDRSVGVTGQLGRRAAMTPVTIRVKRGGDVATYRMQVVNDRFLAPFLVQMAMFSAIDATEKTTGASTLTIRGELRFENNLPPVKVENVYSGDVGTSQMASLAVASPLSYALNAGFDVVKLKSVEIDIDSVDAKRQVQIDQVWTSRATVKPGEAFDIVTVLAGENGFEKTARVSYQVPVGAPAGPIYITVADSTTTNFLEFRQTIATPPKSAAGVLGFLNGLRPNTGAYIRLWRADPVFQVQGEDLPDPPASLSLILAHGQGGLAGATLSRNAKVAEFQIPAGDRVVTGSKTIQVEVKE